jgi:hypothetical protein
MARLARVEVFLAVEIAWRLRRIFGIRFSDSRSWVSIYPLALCRFL